MNNENFNSDENKDAILKSAKKRVGFKKHVTLYVLINLLLWIVYFIPIDKTILLYTLLFVLLAWTIVIIGHYYYAIKWNKKMLEKEMDNLMKED